MPVPSNASIIIVGAFWKDFSAFILWIWPGFLSPTVLMDDFFTGNLLRTSLAAFTPFIAERIEEQLLVVTIFLGSAHGLAYLQPAPAPTATVCGGEIQALAVLRLIDGSAASE